MSQAKILFIDRDGTLINEPDDKQVDRLDKLSLVPGVIPALLKLKTAGYQFVMVTNQDGLGTDSFPEPHFKAPQELLINILSSQGITFRDVLICPHLPIDLCACRKPKTGLVHEYLVKRLYDLEASYVIGDRDTDMELAANMGIKGLRYGSSNALGWNEITNTILFSARTATVSRVTNETTISVSVDLDKPDTIAIDTGLHFFNHMLEQLAKHGAFSMAVSVQGDLEIDDHHTVEDTAIVIGEAMRKALGDKWGIGRYGFLLPMDESLAQVALDLSGRSYLVFNGVFNREKVGDLSTELVPHFFRSFADSLKATLHIDVKGDNSHHMVESIFKGTGRVLRQAIQHVDASLPSTKGVL